ncbi:MAG: hypothetical protein KGL39_28425 [Patescibacteria group bacterium]|nr:hypothetical protein [Patescibacteria group bacterium]
MMLAQADLGQISPALLKQLIIAGGAMIVITAFAAAAVFAGLSYFLERRRARRDELRDENPRPTMIGPDPLRFEKIWPSATVRELNEKYDEHGRRLDKHDEEITSIWNTMRDEDKEIRADVSDKFEAISRALGRIEGALNK